MRTTYGRFGVLLAALFVAPFPVGLVPGTGPLAAAIHRGWDWAVARFAEHVLRIDPPIFQPTGSGDTTWHWVQAALILTLAAAGAALWTAIDRAPRPRLTAALHTYLRYFVAANMLLYGFAKVYAIQFRTPWIGRYDQSIGEMSPMGLLWTFMGHSRAYTIFAGVAEVVGGVLLLWRRTYVLGAFVVIAVMTNVVLLNFCYDVPVKLFSTELLVMAIAIAWPQLRRVVGAALGYRVDDVPPRPRGSALGERLRFVTKLAMLGVLAMIPLYYRAFDRSLERRPTALDGVWTVERMRIDGVDKAALFTDDARWRKLIVCSWGTMVRRATDRRQMLGRAEVSDRELTIVRGFYRQSLPYWRVDATHIIVEGTLDGAQLHLELALDDPPLLRTRGFHWVSEAPFHR
ncbi:MAG: hypothetical protein JO257_25515 [Deltaproteobacteria bacterium]|nr:hypothetical protein [Deltaproteobacteria bacterium]